MTKLVAKPSLEIAQERANRIIQLLKKLNISKNKFCKNYGHHGFTTGALQGWIQCRWSGLTENGANALALAFKEAGIEITPSWLLFGIGEIKLGDISQFSMDQESENVNIFNELKMFQQHNLNVTHVVIKDDSLEPWCSEGDYVAGSIVFGNEINKLVGYPVIVQTTETTDIFTGILEKGNAEGIYTLMRANTKKSSPIIKNISLLNAAKIMWSRRVKSKD